MEKYMQNFGQFLVIPLMFAVIYFMILRPQQQKFQKHKELLEKLKRGDRVVTSGGLIGIIETVSDKEVTLRVDDTTTVRIVKSFISEVSVDHEGVKSSPTPPKKSSKKTSKDIPADK